MIPSATMVADEGVCRVGRIILSLLAVGFDSFVLRGFCHTVANFWHFSTDKLTKYGAATNCRMQFLAEILETARSAAGNSLAPSRQQEALCAATNARRTQ